jgi:hypothetical protein
MVYIGVDLHRKTTQWLQSTAEESCWRIGRCQRADPTFCECSVTWRRGPRRPRSLLRPPSGGDGSPTSFEMPASRSTWLIRWRPKAIANARVKNDAVDAKTLAHLLRTGTLPEAWAAPPEVREARRLVRMRTSLVRMRSRIRAQVHAVLAEHGVVTPMSDLFGKQGRRLLDELRLPELSQGRLEVEFRARDSLRVDDDRTNEVVSLARYSVSGLGTQRARDRLLHRTPSRREPK